MIRPRAASRLVLRCPADSSAKSSLETEAPFSARRVAMFSSACVKTATDTSSKSKAFEDTLTAKVL